MKAIIRGLCKTRVTLNLLQGLLQEIWLTASNALFLQILKQVQHDIQGFAKSSIKKMNNQNLWSFLVLLVLTAGCSASEKSDAYGQFEAIETTVSAEANGKLINFTAGEGIVIKRGKVTGVIDTTQLALKKKELESQLESIRARISSIDAQVEVQQEQLETALTNLKRIESLHKDDAATQQQLDDVGGQVRTLRKQINASQIQKESIRAEINATRVRIEQVEQQIQDAVVRNPVQGTVLNTFVEPHEVVQTGQPLYRVAGLDTLILRIYVSGAQLPNIKIGQNVEVLVDKNAEENQAMRGRISWVASKAEFTPEQIQTKEERVTQVYAVKVRVPNPEGILKIGMPGEVNFNRGSERTNRD